VRKDERVIVTVAIVALLLATALLLVVADASVPPGWSMVP
jgi:hypothetical protein